MSDEVKARVAELEAANAKLNESLKRCRQLVAECQSKLAANANEPRVEREDLFSHFKQGE